MLELILKCVGWKLAAEGLQREKRQREREKGRDRQMERGRERVENRLSFISQSCFTLRPSSLCFLQGSCLVSACCSLLTSATRLLDSPVLPFPLQLLCFSPTWDFQPVQRKNSLYAKRTIFLQAYADTEGLGLCRSLLMALRSCPSH